MLKVIRKFFSFCGEENRRKFISILGAGLIKSKAIMLQTEGGYDTCAKKRVEIAEHMRYLPMGYFNANSIGQITSVTTNVMENLENIATRVVMLVCEGLLTTSIIIIMLVLFDWRIAIVLLCGFILFLLANSRLQIAAGKLAGIMIYSDGWIDCCCHGDLCIYHLCQFGNSRTILCTSSCCGYQRRSGTRNFRYTTDGYIRRKYQTDRT